jgi:hypothetical protein
MTQTAVTESVDTELEKVRSTCSQLLGDRVFSAESIGGGRNSQVYRLTCQSSHQYAAKFYFRHESDRRNRLKTEFSSLQFLQTNGLRQIPNPLLADEARGCAIYEYIEGFKIAPQAVTEREIDAVVELLVSLKELKTAPDSHLLPPASEAFFSTSAIVGNIQQRLMRFSGLSANSGDSEELSQRLEKFFSDRFNPAFDRITRWCQQQFDRASLSFAEEIEPAARTLSPSDFGFHNALIRESGEMAGELAFLDFEYFGWDDPAKTISDFLLHPAMALGEELKQRFVDRILGGFADNSSLPMRVQLLYPLFGLKWCLILLNEFVPQDLLRRGFAKATALDRQTVQIQQLEKAEQMLSKILGDYDRFPYRR